MDELLGRGQAAVLLRRHAADLLRRRRPLARRGGRRGAARGRRARADDEEHGAGRDRRGDPALEAGSRLRLLPRVPQGGLGGQGLPRARPGGDRRRPGLGVGRRRGRRGLRAARRRDRPHRRRLRRDDQARLQRLPRDEDLVHQRDRERLRGRRRRRQRGRARDGPRRADRPPVPAGGDRLRGLVFRGHGDRAGPPPGLAATAHVRRAVGSARRRRPRGGRRGARAAASRCVVLGSRRRRTGVDAGVRFDQTPLRGRDDRRADEDWSRGVGHRRSSLRRRRRQRRSGPVPRARHGSRRQPLVAARQRARTGLCPRAPLVAERGGGRRGGRKGRPRSSRRPRARASGVDGPGCAQRGAWPRSGARALARDQANRNAAPRRGRCDRDGPARGANRDRPQRHICAG